MVHISNCSLARYPAYLPCPTLPPLQFCLSLIPIKLNSLTTLGLHSNMNSTSKTLNLCPLISCGHLRSDNLKAQLFHFPFLLCTLSDYCQHIFTYFLKIFNTFTQLMTLLPILTENGNNYETEFSQTFMHFQSVPIIFIFLLVLTDQLSSNQLLLLYCQSPSSHTQP